eukprot:1161345-Pelagomonas_calceolata.AAC.19
MMQKGKPKKQLAVHFIFLLRGCTRALDEHIMGRDASPTSPPHHRKYQLRSTHQILQAALLTCSSVLDSSTPASFLASAIASRRPPVKQDSPWSTGGHHGHYGVHS